MPTNPLPADKIASLLKTAPQGVSALVKTFGNPAANGYERPPKLGPVSWISDTVTATCAFRGCAAPTYYKCDNIPYCVPHTLNYLSNKLMELRGTELPPNTIYPNGGLLKHFYKVTQTPTDPTQTLTVKMFDVSRWLEVQDYCVNTCIWYIQLHGWDYAEMVDEQTSTRYIVTREVVDISGNGS